MRFYNFCLYTLLILVLLPLPCPAEDTGTAWPAENESEQQQIQPGISYILRGEAMARSGDPFSAIVEYRKAIAAGYNNSDVFRSLSTVLYLAGFIDEAIETLQEAVDLHPKEVYPRQELGVLYFATGNIDKAKETFLGILADNPTIANAYHYLSIISFRQEQFDEAWIYARRAQLLGLNEHSLLDKLLARGNEPLIDQRDPTGNDLCFRQILLPSFTDAENALDRLRQGEMFEVVASTASTGPSANNGGFVGCLFPDELNSILASSLWQQKAYAEPVIVETDRGAHIIQRVQPFDPELWRIQIAALKRPKPVLSDAILKQGLSQKELGRYVVHAGTYNGPVLAASMVSRLRYDKFPAYFYTSPAPDKKGGMIYQVVAGSYPGNADAKKASNRLEKLGIGSSIVDTAAQEEPTQTDEKKTVIAASPESSKEKTKDKTAEPAKPATKTTVATKDKKATTKKTATVENELAKPKIAKAEKPQAKKTAQTKKKTTNKDILAARAKAAKHRKATNNTPTKQLLPATLPLIITRKSNEPTGKYTLHAGTSNNRTKTEAIIARMRKAGLPAFAYLAKTKNGKQIYRLAGGRFNSMKEAKAAHQNLSKIGIDTFIANTK